MMTPAVMELQGHYGELSEISVTIIAGANDQIVDVTRHSGRLYRELLSSELIVVPGAGHMVHHLAPEQIVEAVDRASMRSEAGHDGAENPGTDSGWAANSQPAPANEGFAVL